VPTWWGVGEFGTANRVDVEVTCARNSCRGARGAGPEVSATVLKYTLFAGERHAGRALSSAMNIGREFRHGRLLIAHIELTECATGAQYMKPSSTSGVKFRGLVGTGPGRRARPLNDLEIGDVPRLIA